MKAVPCSYAMILAVLIAMPAYAAERLVPYDDFNTTQIDPDKWSGIEFGPKPKAPSTEAIRQIQDNRLRLVYRAYGRTDSDSGMSRNEFLLMFHNSAAVTAIKATVQVTDTAATSCPSNPKATIAWAMLGGRFFGTAPSTSRSATNDVVATIRLVRRSDSTDPPDVLRVRAGVFHCANVVLYGWFNDPLPGPRACETGGEGEAAGTVGSRQPSIHLPAGR